MQNDMTYKEKQRKNERAKLPVSLVTGDNKRKIKICNKSVKNTIQSNQDVV